MSKLHDLSENNEKLKEIYRQLAEETERRIAAEAKAEALWSVINLFMFQNDDGNSEYEEGKM